MPPKSNVQYSAPAVPKFLQSLHAQVNGGRGAAGPSTSRDGEPEDELSAMFREASRGGHDEPEGDADDVSGDEWDGAQVVVLKDGKHLSREELEQAKQEKDSKAASGSGESLFRAAGSSWFKADLSSCLLFAVSSSRPAPLPPLNPSLPTPASKRKKAPIDSSSLLDEAVPSTAAGSEAETKKSKKAKDDLAGVKDLIAAEKKRKAVIKRDKEAKEIQEKKKKKGGGGLSFQFED